MIQPPKLPFLEFLSWQIVDPYRLAEADMLASYERGWRYRHLVHIPNSELGWIERLAQTGKSWLGSEFMDFRISHHRVIHGILEKLNRELLSECRAYFGGVSILGQNI